MRFTAIYLRLLSLILVGFSCFIPPASVWAQGVLPYNVVPPAPYEVPVEQPDGTALRIIARGNQFQHWAETVDGYTVIKNQAGFYEYATEQGGVVRSTGVLAQDQQQRSLPEQREILSLKKHIRPTLSAEQIQQARQQLSPFRNARTQATASMPSQGKIKVLAICIDYPDYPATYQTSDMLGLLNGPSSKPTFRQYYLENSYGKLDISVDVVGWVRAGNGYEHYGYNGGQGYPRAQDLVAEAIDGAERAGVNFSEYDNNNDGSVDGIIVIHSGPGAEEGTRYEYFLSHRWAINSKYYDARYVSDYITLPETRARSLINIGIFCHEFGHLLGLPDLYDTNTADTDPRDPDSYVMDDDSNGIGDWGLMGTGGYLGGEAYPAGMTAWSKEKLGWAEVKDITGQYGTYTLNAASQNNEFYKIKTPNSNEYFLLENRQQQGIDAGLNGTGLAIWHIDAVKTAMYPPENFVNADHTRKGVDLEEADGRADLDKHVNRGDQGDLFPGISGNKSFNHTSSPNADIYATVGGSKETGIDLENIQEVNAQITFTYRNEGAGVGETCAEPATAAVGKNQSDQVTTWHEFTMPKNGGISIASATTDGTIAVYTSCNETPIAQSSTANLTVGYLTKNQKLLIKWERSRNASLPADWTLKVENSVADRDSLALVAIYQQTGGEQWRAQENWLRGQVASWEGVKIENGRVVELQLDRVGLSSPLPADLYLLTGLKKLTVREASLGGALSAELTKLTALEELVVEAKGLKINFLPGISSLANLKKLSLTSVNVDGALPATIGQLTRLEELVLSDAQITGKLPEALKNNNLLVRIDLSQNQLTGAIPAAIFTLPNLTYLALNDNRLESLPSNLLASAKLRTCYLQNNQLQGALPRDVSRDTNTALTLILGNNQFTGSVPEVWKDILFDELAINNNQLSGEFPSIGMPLRLDISHNQFTKLPALAKSSLTRDATCVLICRNNQFTFEDLVPNQAYLACSSCQDRYAPQPDVMVNLDRNLALGSSSSIELPFDQAVSGSQYVWYQEDNEVSRTNKNSLTITAFSSEQVGSYRCAITNTSLPGLTIQAVGIDLDYQQKQAQTIQVPDIPAKQFGDGPFALEARSSAGLPLTYQKVEGPVAVEGNTVTIQGAGDVTIKAVSAGNDQFESTEALITFTIAKGQPTITVGRVQDKTYGDEPFQLDISATNDLAVTLTVEMGNVTLDNGLVLIEGVGEVRIRASRDESDDYEAADPVTVVFSVSQAQQTLFFDPVADTTYRPDGVIPLTATLTSGLDVQYEVVSGGVEIVDGIAIMKSAGPATIRATHPGDANHLAAEAIVQSFTIAQSEQELYFEEIDAKYTTDEPFTLMASSTSDLPVMFRVLRGSATIDSDGQLTITGSGEVVVEAYQEGNNNYLPAVPLQQQFLVLAADKQNQDITVKEVPDTVIVGETLLLDITVSSGLTPSILVGGPATLAQGVLSFNQVGDVTLQISQPGNEEYNAAATFEKTIVVLITRPDTDPLAQNLIYGSTERTFGEVVEIRAASGLPLTLEVLEGPAVITEDGLVEMIGVGIVRIRTQQEGNDEYEPIDEEIEFVVAKATQTIVFEAVELNDSTFLLQVTVSSGLPVTYTLQSGEATITGDTLYARGEEAVVVTATQSGNEHYDPAFPQSKTFRASVVTSTTELAPDIVRIYPNPSPGVFLVTVAPHVVNARYWVVNLQGQQLFTGTLLPTEEELDLSSLAAGTYVLMLQTDRGSSHYRLLKQ